MPTTSLGYIYLRVGDSYDVQLLTKGVKFPNDRGVEQTWLGHSSKRHIAREPTFEQGSAAGGKLSKWTKCDGPMCKWCHGGWGVSYSVEDIPVRYNGANMKVTLNKWQHDIWVKEMEKVDTAGSDPLGFIWRLSYPVQRQFTAVATGPIEGVPTLAKTMFDGVAVLLSTQEETDLKEVLEVTSAYNKSFPKEQFVMTLVHSMFNWKPDRAATVVDKLYDPTKGTLDITKAKPKRSEKDDDYQEE